MKIYRDNAAAFTKDGGVTIDRLETPREKLVGEMLPRAAATSVAIGLLCVPALLTGPLALALPAAGWLAQRLLQRDILKAMDDDSAPAPKSLYGTDQPSPALATEVAALARTMGMKPPHVLVANDTSSDFYDAAAALPYSRAGRNGIVVIGGGFLQKANDDERRAVITHELAHLRLSHGRDRVSDVSTSLVTVAAYAGIAFAGIATGAWLPAAAAIAGGYLLRSVFESRLQRYHEKICDRAAALVTGKPEALSGALEKVKGGKPKLFARIRRKLVPLAPLRRFLFSGHPSNKRRFADMARFFQKNSAFCETRRQRLSKAFSETTSPARVLCANRLKNETSAPQSPRQGG